MRRVGLLLVLTALVPTLSGCGCSDDRSGPAPIERTVIAEVLSRVEAEEFRETTELVTITNGQEELEVLVTGRPDLLEVGGRYEFAMSIPNPDDGRLHAFLDYDAGGCGSSYTTIRTVAADGSRSDVEIPSRLPSWPISRRTLFLGFGALAALTFIFRAR